MSVTALGETEVRLQVRFPAAFRAAVLKRRAPQKGSRYILLPLDEIDTTAEWGLPIDGIVVGRSIAGGYVVLTFADESGVPRVLADSPRLWEPEDDDDDREESVAPELRLIGDSFDDVLNPARFEKTRLCPHCGSDSWSSPCSVCGRRWSEPPAADPDRDVARTMVQALVRSGELVTRAPTSTERVIYVTTELLHQLDDVAVAAEEILNTWDDMPEVEEVFIDPEALARRFLAKHWKRS